MTDFNGAKPVMTVRDDEFKIKIVDGASGSTATSILSILADGTAYSVGVNDFGIPVLGKDGSGNAVILPVPMPITDNGGSLTVDASNLDIRDLSNTTDSVTAHQGGNWTVSITDGSETLLINADGSLNAVVTATNLDIRDLTHVSDSVKIGDGTDFLAVNTDGSINVNVKPAGTKVCDYQTTATVGVNSESLHFYVVTNAKTFEGLNVLVGARGAVKVRIGYSSNGTSMTSVKAVYFQDPKENRQFDISRMELLGDGTAAFVVGITNLDAASSDVYSTLQGSEI